MEDFQALWQKALLKFEPKVSTVSYELWIKPLEPLDFKDNTLFLAASSITAKNQIIKNHTALFSDIIPQVYGSQAQFQILDTIEKDEYINKSKNIQSYDETGFNSKYTFENYVVGKSNQFVYAGARAVAENPGKKFNPFFIYGGVGLGKTHLLHAVGNYILQHFPKLKIKYVTCEKFTNDYIESLLSKRELSKVEFREKYRSLDILLVDDIQFLSKKDSTQEEFFHTFNDLYQNNKQIILSSDRPPKEIATLAARLKSRFASGLIQDIQPPEYETRIAILRKKAQEERYFMDDEVFEFIAEKLDTNIRELEGMLSKIHFFATLIGKKKATIDDAKEAMKDKLNQEREEVTIDLIIEQVCKYYGVSKAELTGKRRSREFVEPRMMAIYLTNELLDMPLISIGKYFGGRDHTTIIHSRDKVTDLVKNNK
ncbi:MAG: chromosomal replication initiator protein DnaA, partial [Clostridia bacterium]|nr:chromosomal replication initiator protein DnaA [Clostridia bacterium]